MPQLSGWTGLILLLVVLLLFAAPKLPQLAKSLGQSMTIFKKEIKAGKEGDEANADTSTQSSGTSASGEGTDSSSTK